MSALIKNPPPGAPAPPILPPQGGYLFLDRTQFRASFAADVSADAAVFMADSQVPWGLDALNGAVSEPAWKSKPSWYLQKRLRDLIDVHAASPMSQLRKSSSAASHFIPASPSFVALGLFSASSRSSASPRNKQDRVQPEEPFPSGA